jgi:Pectate lyase superfamily protein
MKLGSRFASLFVLSLTVAVVTFQGCRKSSGAENAPVIFNYSLSGKAGDVIGLQGSRFGSNPQVFLSRPSNSPIQMKVVNKGNNYVAVMIPESESLGLYKIQVSDGTNSSKEVYLNRAHAMSFDTPEIAANGTFRIFGRNLLLPGATPTVRFVNPSTGASLNATVMTTGSDAYVLKVTAPSGITPGVLYDVYVSNGHGGKVGETKADKTLLGLKGGTDHWQLGVPWAGDYDFYNNVYNVKTDPRLSIHAVGDGVHDDQAAIQNAISVAAKAGGGVVRLPAGTYKLAMITKDVGIRMASRVVLEGEGRDKTIIKYGYGSNPSTTGGYAVIWPDKTSVAGIADLTIQNLNEKGNWLKTMAKSGNVSQLFIQRVGFDMSWAEGIFMHAQKKLVIQNSVFTHTFNQVNPQNRIPLVLDDNMHMVFRGNRVTHATGWYAFNKVSNSTIENNRFTRDGSYKAVQDCCRNLNLNFTTDITLLNNTFDVINGPIVGHNDGETILSEGGGAKRTDESIGTVSSAGSQTLQDSSKNWNSSTFTNKAIVTIVSGKGTGQWRTITGLASNNTLKLDRPWDVIPESGSHYATFGWSAANWIVKGNTLTDNPRGIMLYSASSRDVAIVGNTLVNNGGIYLRTDQRSAANTHTVIYNVQILNNKVSNTNNLRGAYIGNISAHVNKETTFGVGLIGLEIRDNTLTAYTPNTKPNTGQFGDEPISEGYRNLVRYEYGSTTPFKEIGQPALLGTIFQGNTANNSDNSFQVSTGAYQTTIWKSTTNNYTRFLKDDVFQGASHGSTTTVIEP